MNKKGFYFMTLTLFFLLIFLTIFYVISSSEENESQQSVGYRIQLMDNFLSDFENDAPRAMYVASFRGFIALEEHVFTTGEYYSDIQTTFSEVFYNGTINNTPFSVMNESSMSDYLYKVNLIANQLGLNMDFELGSVEIEQYTPWELKVTINGTINLTDSTNVGSWEYETSIPAYVPIYDLRDPLYTVGSQGQLPSPVKKWEGSLEFVNQTNNDTSVLEDFINGTYYIESNSSPSFLMRFQGQTGNSSQGIESIVNLRILADQNIVINSGRSVVDYIYFGNQSTSNYCDIDGLIFNPNWFILDSQHLSVYGVQNLDKTPC